MCIFIFCLFPSIYPRKIPIIGPGLIFVQKAVFLGLFSGELIFGEAYYWKEFCVSKWVGLGSKTASTNSPWAYIWEGYTIGRIFASEIWGAYFRKNLFFGGIII